MKKTLRILSLVLILAMTVAVLLACGGKKPPVEDTEVTEPVETEPPAPTYDKTLLTDWLGYTLLFPEGTSEAVSNAFYNFTSAIVNKYGSMPKANSDFLMPGETVPENTLEVLIGATNRAESAQGAEGLRANDYFIGMINNRLVIVGGSDKATANAINHCTAYLLGDEGLMYPTEGYLYTSEYTVDKLTVGGVDISEFTVIRGNGMSSGDRMLVDYLRDLIADICGASVKVNIPSSKEQTYEILIGNTGRALTSKELEKGTYSIEQTDTKLALYGNGESSETFVLKYLIQDVLSNIPKGESYDIKLENIIGEKFVAPSLVESNLPTTLGDFRGKYDSSLENVEAVMERFFLSVEELPDEVTVISPMVLEDYLPAINKQVYVSNASGDDNNSGSKNAPFKTIAKAVSAMKNANGGVIWVEGDTYELDETIIIGAAQSGTIITPLFIKSYGEKDVTLTSNVIIESAGFRLVDSAKDKVAARLHEDVQDKVYCINLYDDLGWTEKDIVSVTTSGHARLYVDGEEFSLARFPNAYYDDGVTPVDGMDLLYFNHVYEMGSVTNTANLNYWAWIERANNDPNLTPQSVIGWEVRIPDTRGASAPSEAYLGEEIKNWVNTGDIWYYGNVYSGWEHGYYNISPDCVHGNGLLGAAKEGGYYSLKSMQPCPQGAMVSGNSAAGRNTFYLFNAIEALDAPGEWFIDKETGYLYVYPKSEDITKQQIAYSGANKLSSLMEIKASYVVLDGIGVDGCNGFGIRVQETENVIIQNATTKNTQSHSIYLYKSRKCAVLNSDLSYSYGMMISMTAPEDQYDLRPSDVFIQNNTFSNTPPSESHAVSLAGCRVVVSHNDFIDCCLSGGSGAGFIIEYNKFEGGNRFITDGGMVYFGGVNNIGHHVRYNLLHMFKATHQAVYFDGKGSNMYSYGNVISTLGAWTNSHKAWYTSSGHGSVCYANIMVLRNASQIDALKGKDTDEDSESIRKGDDINQSALFYYYYGNGDSRNGGAGHWWVGYKQNELSLRYTMSDEEAWRAHFPHYMTALVSDMIIMEAQELADYSVYYDPQKLSGKTLTYTDLEDGHIIYVPEYEYLDDSGARKTMPEKTVVAKDGQGVTLTLDDIAAMERLSRQPAYNAIWNNIILGGSTDRDKIITNNVESYKGSIKGLTYKENNFFEFDYDKIMVDAENYDYTITDEAWARIESELGANCTAILKDIDYTRAGLTYGK